MAAETVAPALPRFRNGTQSRTRKTVRLVLGASLVAVVLSTSWAWHRAGELAPDATRVAPVFLEITGRLEGRGARWPIARPATRQLARLAEPTAHGFWGRGRTALRVVALEARFDETEILHAFVERADYGMGHHGVAAASRAYFDHEPSTLTLEESVILAGLVAAPPQAWLDEESLRTARSRGVSVLRAAPAIGTESERTGAATSSLERVVPAYLSPRERGATEVLPARAEHAEHYYFAQLSEPANVARVAPLLALRVLDFEREAHALFGLVAVEHYGVYNDRYVRGSDSTPSAHAFGQAFDLVAFRFDDGAVVRVIEHDDPATQQRLAPLEELLRAYCDVLITWREDPVRHRDHMHCEVLGERASLLKK